MATQPTLDVHLANIIRGYLSTAASVTAGLPSTTVLPRVPVYEEKAKVFPLLVVAGAMQGEGRRQRVNVVVALHARWLEAKKEGEVVATPQRELHATWMRTVWELLHDHQALYAYIAALPEVDRTGWQLRRVWPGSVGVLTEDKEMSMEITPCSIALDIRLPPRG